MSETTEFSVGSEVACSDGVCGDLRRVVIDPVARALTHLVVEPRHRPGAGHLVPIDLLASTAGGSSCTAPSLSSKRSRTLRRHSFCPEQAESGKG
jgi:hypothetical protein